MLELAPFAMLLLQTLLPFLNTANPRSFHSQEVPKQVEKILAKSEDAFHPRISYGAPASIEDFPYFASLSNCGATIISDTWVITAAHCIEDLDEYSVWVGGESFSNSKKVSIDEVVVHPFYHEVDGVPINDIALLRLTKPLEFGKKIMPLKLPKDNYSNAFVDILKWYLSNKRNYDYYESEQSDESDEYYNDDDIYYKEDIHVFVGRGLDENGYMSEKITQTELNRLPSSLCYNLLYPYTYSYIKPVLSLVDTFSMCGVRVKNLSGAEYGDSGSPVVKDDTLEGIISYGYWKDRVVFLVKVAPYVTWIKSVTGV